MYKFLGILSVVLWCGFQLLPSNAWAWNEDHHRWIVSDAISYMDPANDPDPENGEERRQGDPLMLWVQEWLYWAPGYNALFERQNWIDDDACVDAYPAFCALRDEAANTDWYSDMEFKINRDLAFTVCAFSPEFSWVKDFACTCYAADYWGVLPISSSHPMGYHLTSFNHMLGVRYDADAVSRAFTGEDEFCMQRDDEERLGYKFRNFSLFCNEEVEGDCMGECQSTLRFGLLDSGVGFVKINPGENDDDAGVRYRNVTCHSHDGCQLGMSIPDARYFPADNVAEYWMKQFVADAQNDQADIIKLGPVLHATQDAFEPHHIYNYLGRGHEVFEGRANDYIDARAKCRAENLTTCDESFLFDQFYNPNLVAEILYDWRDVLVPEMLVENIVTRSARRASLWVAGSKVEDEEEATYRQAIVYGADDDQVPNYELEQNWRGVASLGHNLAVAGTYAMLNKAFSTYYEIWKGKNYCSAVLANDEDAWRRIVPGPIAGEGMPFLDGTAAWYINFMEGRGETRHPYYNEKIQHGSNVTSFSVPYVPTLQFDTTTDRVMLTFDENTDWNAASEGDHLRIDVRLFDESLRSLGEWQPWLRVEDPEQLRNEGVVIEGVPFGYRLANVRIELAHGSNVLVAGDNGTILRYDGTTMQDEGVGGEHSISGLWGVSMEQVFASTIGGHVLRYDAFEGDGWSQMDVDVMSGFENIWGVAIDEVYAVGNWWGYIYQYDGETWEYLRSFGADFTGIHGIWGTGSDNIYLAGGWGQVWHYDGSDWELLYRDFSTPLMGIWGRPGGSIYAVGGEGVVLRYDGLAWASIWVGVNEPLMDIWGDGDNVFIVGYNGLVLHNAGSGWSTMDTGTEEDLLNVWGNDAKDVYAVGTNGTMIHFDGTHWSAIETGISSTLRAVWGGKPACTTGSKYGFRLKTVAIDYYQDGRSPPNMDSAQIAESIAHWIRQALDGGDFGDIGVISDCAPGSACDDELQGVLQDAFAQARAAGIALEVEQVFDMVLDSLAQVLPGRQIQPALVAYSVVKEAARVFPGESLIDSGLMSQAIAWSMDRQGMRSRSLKNGRLDLHAELNFSHPKVGNRPRPGKNKAGALPGVDAPNTSGYPGFREPTEEELSSVDALIEYVRQKRKSVEAYGARHRTELLLERIDVFDAILATDDGSDAQSAEQIVEMRQQLQVVAVELWAVSDFDQDQVRNGEDLCPEDCALGMDADLDGCVDEVCGLEEEVALLDAWWLPKMILGMRARLACLKSVGPGPSGHGHGHAYGHDHGNGLGPANAALAQLRVFLSQLSNYVRIGWIDGKQAGALVDFAENSRDVLLGDFDDLECF